MGWLSREWTDKEKKEYLLENYGQKWMDKIGWWTFQNQSDFNDCYIWQLTISHDPWCLGIDKMYKTKEEAQAVMIERFEKDILEIKELINKLKESPIETITSECVNPRIGRPAGGVSRIRHL